MSKDTIVLLALKSLITEVSLYPKPGLVDPIDSGSHNDMDYHTFLDSCFALVPGFYEYYEAGHLHKGSPSELFDKIRSIGMNNEKEMFDATGGINTHKGANFLFGVVLAAIAYKEEPDILELRQTIMEMTQGLVSQELTSLEEFKTHGEKMYKRYGYAGIRGEVENGLPNVFEVALPILQENTTQEAFDTTIKKTLLKLIATNDDANMLKRGGLSGLQYGKELANTSYDSIDDHLNFMNTQFVKRNLSPGGSADLLALSIFIYHYQNLKSV